MTQYLISFGAHAMDHIPDEDAPAVAGAAHAGGPGGRQRRRICVRRRAGKPAGEHRGHRRGGHRRPVPAGHRRIHARRGALTRGGAAVGGQDRRRLPLRAGGPGDRGPTPNSTRCSARLIADGDVPAASDRRRPAALEQDLPWRRPDNAGLRIDLSRDAGQRLLDRT
jgi:hypothetical protein